MKPHLRILSLAAGALALGAPASAHVTHGSWPNGDIDISVSLLSFPIGSVYRTALERVSDRFYYEQGSGGYFVQTFDDLFIGVNNGENEVWFSNDPANAPAVTLSWLSGTTITEADVLFYVGEPWTDSSAKLDSYAYGGFNEDRFFEATAAHEYGHVAGLSHENGEYNIMGEDWNHVSCNGDTIRSYVGEDAADGLVSLYGTCGCGIEDLSATLFKHEGANGEYSTHEQCFMTDSFGVELGSTVIGGQKRYDVVSGQVVGVEFSFENQGESTQTVEAGYYLSTNSVISVADTLLTTRSMTLGRNEVFTYRRNVTIPTDLDVNQTYYLGVIVDHDDQVAETTAANNAAYHTFRVGCASLPSVTSYNAGSNPNSLTVSPLRPGAPYTIDVKVFLSGGHQLTVPFGFDTPTNVKLGGGQRLLCIDGGAGEILALPAKPGPNAHYLAFVPPAASLCGFTFTMQALHYGNVVPFALSNAQDVRIGN